MHDLAHRSKTRRVVQGTLLAVFAAVSLLLAGAAPADSVPPTVNLSSIAVNNGTAAVSGTLGGSPDAALSLTINGQQVTPNAAGAFNSTIDLSGKSVLTVAVKDPTTGQVTTTTIPLTTNIVGQNGVIPPDVLKTLQQAGISLIVPANGFQSIDGLPLTITGKLADKDQLLSLKVNGVEVLPQVKPDGSFAQTVSGSSKDVTVTATDKQGVSQSTVYPLSFNSSVVKTTSGSSVSAVGASGLRIATVRYSARNVAKSKRIAMTVTVKDRRGYLVRGATLRVRPSNTQHGAMLGGQQSKLSGKLGQATFVLKLRRTSFPKAKRLFTVTTGVTPNATAKRTTSVRVPRLMKAKPRARKR